MVVVIMLATSVGIHAQEVRIEVQADQVLHPVSCYLTGACLEDLNHQVYGGLYSQMIYGESFQESSLNALKEFKSFGGNWQVQGEELRVSQGDGSYTFSPYFVTVLRLD